MLVPAHLVKQSALWLLCGLVLVNGSCSKEVQSPTVILGLSTSFGNSGLFEVLQPAYEQLSRGSLDRQVAQSQPIAGTPDEVPVPRKVIRTVDFC